MIPALFQFNAAQWNGRKMREKAGDSLGKVWYNGCENPETDDMRRIA